MAASAEHPLPEPTKPLLGLLNGIAQSTFYGNTEITEELLREQLYPETSSQEFGVLLAKMKGIIKSIASADMDSNQLEAFLTAQTKKPGGITTDHAIVVAKFWKNQRAKIHESLINQSKWENSLKNISWRIDLKTQSRHIDQMNSPVAIVEMELEKNGQESELLTMEFDETELNKMLKKLSKIEDSIISLTQKSSCFFT
uniref:COMM domain-containing protein 1 n=1 Tax=Crotalus adamanteus TaxID=8729 RepID=A0A0F7ZBA0_CROAD